MKYMVALLACLAIIACGKEKQFTAEIGTELSPVVYKPLMQKVASLLEKKGLEAATEYYRSRLEAEATAVVEQRFDVYRERFKVRDLSIRRISWRFRNPANAPGSWQETVFREWLAAKKDNKPLEVRVHEDNGIYSVMTPVFIEQPMCLQCHGNVNTTGLKARQYFKNLYPSDRARDFHLGQLRGATVTEVRFE